MLLEMPAADILSESILQPAIMSFIFSWRITDGEWKNELHSLQLSLNRDEAPDESIGLVNVNQRIRLFYGESYGLQISSTPGKGTRIEILLPLRNHSENMTDITGGTDSL